MSEGLGRPQRRTGAWNLLQVEVAVATKRLAGKRLAVLTGTKTTWPMSLAVRSMEFHIAGSRGFWRGRDFGSAGSCAAAVSSGFASCQRCFGELLQAGSIPKHDVVAFVSITLEVCRWCWGERGRCNLECRDLPTQTARRREAARVGHDVASRD